MNNTNRALNRILLAVTGLVTLAIGVGLIALATVPALRSWYQRQAPILQDQLTEWWHPLPLLDTGTSWYWVIGLVLLLLVVLALLRFIFRQGHGQQPILIHEHPTPTTTTIIESAVAEHGIHQALTDHPDILSVAVSTYQVHHTPVLKISATCRRGTSPRAMTTTIENIVTTFDQLLGREIPVLIQLSGGFRARYSRTSCIQ